MPDTMFFFEYTQKLFILLTFKLRDLRIEIFLKGNY